MLREDVLRVAVFVAVIRFIRSAPAVSAPAQVTRIEYIMSHNRNMIIYDNYIYYFVFANLLGSHTFEYTGLYQNPFRLPSVRK